MSILHIYTDTDGKLLPEANVEGYGTVVVHIHEIGKDADRGVREWRFGTDHLGKPWKQEWYLSPHR